VFISENNRLSEKTYFGVDNSEEFGWILEKLLGRAFTGRGINGLNFLSHHIPSVRLPQIVSEPGTYSISCLSLISQFPFGIHREIRSI